MNIDINIRRLARTLVAILAMVVAQPVCAARVEVVFADDCPVIAARQGTVIDRLLRLRQAVDDARVRARVDGFVVLVKKIGGYHDDFMLNAALDCFADAQVKVCGGDEVESLVSELTRLSRTGEAGEVSAYCSGRADAADCALKRNAKRIARYNAWRPGVAVVPAAPRFDESGFDALTRFCSEATKFTNGVDVLLFSNADASRLELGNLTVLRAPAGESVNEAMWYSRSGALEMCKAANIVVSIDPSRSVRQKESDYAVAKLIDGIKRHMRATKIRSRLIVVPPVGGAVDSESIKAALSGESPSVPKSACSRSGERELTIMSYNIRYMQGGSDDSWEPGRSVEVIRKVRPDILGVQEINRFNDWTFGLDAPTALGHMINPLWRFEYGAGKIDAKTKASEGVAVYALEDAVSVKRLPLPDKNGYGRMFLAVEYPEFWIANSHFSLHEDMRLKGLGIIGEFIKSIDKPLFFVGDWNAGPDSKTLREVRRHFKILSDDKIHTFPSFRPHATIDYIAVDKAHAGKVKVKSFNVLHEPYASDHLPLVLKVSIAK